jgi:uncharacterized protein YjiS (DUF1127 family)
MVIATSRSDRALDRPGFAKPAKPAARASADALAPSAGRVYWLRSPAVIMRGWRPRAIESAKPSWLWGRFSTIVAGLSGRIRQWEELAHSREFLLRLDDHGLRDIGLTRMDAQRELNKPFWRK